MEPPPNSCPQLADRCELVGSRMTAVRVVPDNILRGSKPADIQQSDRMLRHSTGFKLANQGVDTRSLQHYLGHEHSAHGALHRAIA